jgi:diguanylate cyclase (GGDEF)-like protein/PAS domain S-box-containing protein
MKASIAVALLCLMLFSAAASSAPEPLRLGVFAHRPVEILSARYDVLARYLDDRLPDRAVAIEVLGVEGLETALRENRLDLVLTNPRHYVLLRSRNSLSGVIATLKKHGAGDRPTHSLGGVIITRSGRDDIETLADIPGQRIAIPTLRHLGGYATQLFELQSAGLPLPDAADLQIVGVHDEVVARVLRGDVDVGFIRTGVLEDLVARGTLTAGMLKVINPQSLAGFPYVTSTRLYPEWPLVALPHVDDRTLSRLIASLHELQEHPEILEQIGIAGFAPPADYTVVSEMLRALRVAPYDQLPEVTFGEFWFQHRQELLAGLLAVLLILGLSVILLRRNLVLRERTLALGESTRRLQLLTDLQQAVGTAIAGLIDVPAKDRLGTLADLLETLGRRLGAGHVYLLRHRTGDSTGEVVQAWSIPGRDDQGKVFQPIRDYAWLAERLSGRELLWADDVATLVADDTSLPARCPANDHRAMLVISLGHGTMCQGLLVFECMDPRYGETDAGMEPLTVLGQAVANAGARWQAELELEDSRRFTEVLLESLPLPVFYKDARLRYLGVNRSFERLMGVSREQLVGKDVFAIHPADSAELYDRKDRQLMDQDGSQTYASLLTAADGHEHEVVFDKAVIRDEDGAPMGLIGAITDMTELRRQERALQLRAQRDEALLALPALAERLSELEFMQRALEQVERLTGSRIGFCHFVHVDEDTIELVAWSRRTLDHYCNAVVDRHYPVHQAGVWADALRRREPVVVNDYPGLPGKQGLPEGHAALERLVSVPVFEGGQVRMLMGVGNKAVDYDETDIETVRLIANETWRLAQHQRSLAHLKLAASVFAHAREGIMVTDPDAAIVDVNEALCDILGYSRAQLIGQNPRMLKSGRQGSAFYAEMWHSLLDLGYWRGEIWNRRSSGELVALLLNIGAVRAADGRVQHYVALFSNITTQKEYQRQLEHIAHYDMLTSLPNRVLLADRIQQALAQAKRRRQSLAVVYLDLDGFKAVNDTHGHEAGDRLLITVAGRMREKLREGDTIARLGGDEFVLVLLDLEDQAAVAPQIERLLEAVSEPVRLGRHDVRVSASIGVTFYPQRQDTDPDLLLRQADRAMYQAKLLGRNRYHIFDADDEYSQRGETEILQRMQHGLRDGEFIFYLQPKVNMRSGEVIGAEALIRWDHPEQGLLSPHQFLDYAAGKPLMDAFGHAAIAFGLEQLEYWRERGLDLQISVNIDAYQLQQPGFIADLRTSLGAHPSIGPGRLVLEVLETSALQDIELVSRMIREAGEIGVPFSLDDFGTGYSSLSYLKNLPAAELKIDQTFVRDCLGDPEDLAILDGVLGLAAAFQRRVVAEGVETAEHGELLLALGCELAQGYAIARPMAKTQFEDWLADWTPDPLWRTTQTLSRDARPVLFAGVEHRAWVGQVEAFLDGLQSRPPRPSESCSFGIWLKGHGHDSYRDHPSFEEIVFLHGRIHTLGDALIADHMAGQTAGEAGRIGELRKLRDRLTGLLREIRQSPPDG